MTGYGLRRMTGSLDSVCIYVPHDQNRLFGESDGYR